MLLWLRHLAMIFLSKKTSTHNGDSHHCYLKSLNQPVEIVVLLFFNFLHRDPKAGRSLYMYQLSTRFEDLKKEKQEQSEKQNVSATHTQRYSPNVQDFDAITFMVLILPKLACPCTFKVPIGKLDPSIFALK